jgi:hypothetical protein
MTQSAVQTLEREKTLAVAPKPSAVADGDQEPPHRFLVVDPRVPAQIRQLLDEADGCMNLAFTTGGTACVRRAMRVVMATEGVLTDDYSASLASLREKHPAIAPTLFTVLDLLGTGDDPLRVDALTALIATVKAIVYEVYVLGIERLDALEYLSELLASMKRDSLSVSPHKASAPGAKADAGARARRTE